MPSADLVYFSRAMMPALLTRMSSFLVRDLTSFAALRTDSRLARSSSTNLVETPGLSLAIWSITG